MRVLRSEFVVEVLERNFSRHVSKDEMAAAASSEHEPHPWSVLWQRKEKTCDDARAAVAFFKHRLLNGGFMTDMEGRFLRAIAGLSAKRAEIRVRHVQEIDVTAECGRAAEDSQDAQPLPPETVTPDIETLRGEPTIEDDLFLEDGGRGKLRVVGPGGRIVGEQG